METFVQTIFGSVIIIAISILVAGGSLALLQRLWPAAQRGAHNDVVGPSVGVIGTTYAVFIAFMLSGVWNDFQSAQVNAEQESNCLVNVCRLADRLPADNARQMQELTRQYATAMIKEEWPAMERESSSEAGHVLIKQMWKTLLSVQGQDAAQQIVIDHSFSELTGMTQHRRVRLLQSRKHLPPILWAVLIVGGIVTVASTCLFGVQNFYLHLSQVFAIAFLVSLMLVAIADIDRPFQGTVRVPPDGFHYALDTMNRWQLLPR